MWKCTMKYYIDDSVKSCGDQVDANKLLIKDWDDLTISYGMVGWAVIISQPITDHAVP